MSEPQQEESFEERMARQFGESMRGVLVSLAEQQGLDPEKVLANLNLTCWVGPAPTIPGLDEKP